MPKNKKSPIIYIAGPGYDQHFYKQFEPLLSGISDHFEMILRKLHISSNSGNTISVNLCLHATDPDKIEAYTEPETLGSSYRIVLSAGLSYHLWLASRFMLTDYKFFPWLDKCKVQKREGSPSRKGRLADFAFYIATYYILLHELAHIVLGHCDYIGAKNGIPVDEFKGPNPSLSDKDLRVLRAFEAEADRQAGEWILAFFEGALGPTGRGIDITFPSRVAAYEFYVYTITSVFVLLQQLTLRLGKRHPLPNERQYTVLVGVDTFLKKFKPKERDLLFQQVTLFMSLAAQRLGLLGAQTPLETAKAALGMMYVDDVIRETNIRSFQHRVMSRTQSSASI